MSEPERPQVLRFREGEEPTPEILEDIINASRRALQASQITVGGLAGISRALMYFTRPKIKEINLPPIGEEGERKLTEVRTVLDEILPDFIAFAQEGRAGRERMGETESVAKIDDFLKAARKYNPSLFTK